MSEHRYPTSSLIADYIRTAAGLIMTAGPLAIIPWDGLAVPLLGAAAVVFAAFGFRTALRQAGRLVMDDQQLVEVGPFGRSLAWRDMTAMRLRYFATRRDRERGWMQLVVKSPETTLRLDSGIDDFAAIVRRAAQAARENRLLLAPATIDNLRVFGITLEEPGQESRQGVA